MSVSIEQLDGFIQQHFVWPCYGECIVSFKYIRGIRCQAIMSLFMWLDASIYIP